MINDGKIENSINIGKYLIIQDFMDGTCWIGINGNDPKLEGEGVEIDKYKLEEVIDKFYKDNF